MSILESISPHWQLIELVLGAGNYLESISPQWQLMEGKHKLKKNGQGTANGIWNQILAVLLLFLVFKFAGPFCFLSLFMGKALWRVSKSETKRNKKERWGAAGSRSEDKRKKEKVSGSPQRGEKQSTRGKSKMMIIGTFLAYLAGVCWGAQQRVSGFKVSFLSWCKRATEWGKIGGGAQKYPWEVQAGVWATLGMDASLGVGNMERLVLLGIAVAGVVSAGKNWSWLELVQKNKKENKGGDAEDGEDGEEGLAVERSARNFERKGFGSFWYEHTGYSGGQLFGKGRLSSNVV